MHTSSSGIVQRYIYKYNNNTKKKFCYPVAFLIGTMLQYKATDIIDFSFCFLCLRHPVAFFNVINICNYNTQKNFGNPVAFLSGTMLQYMATGLPKKFWAKIVLIKFVVQDIDFSSCFLCIRQPMEFFNATNIYIYVCV